MTRIHRRALLRCALAAAGAGLCPGVLAQTQGRKPAAAPLRGALERLGGAGGNIVLLSSAEGLALVDSGAPEHRQDIARFLEEAHGGARAGLLFNTHWHLGHTGGNEHVVMPGAPIVAHENTRLWMSTRFYVDWQDETYMPRPEAARPTRTFHSSDPQPLEVDFGGQRIEYGHLRQAHTDGDIYVRFPEQNVIAAGGAVTAKTYPIMDYITGGWIGGLVEATEKLIALSDSDTLIVPQSGPVQSREDLVAQRDMLAEIRERIETMAVQGKSPEDMVAAGITNEFDERWSGNRELFISNAYDGLWWNRMRSVIA